MSAALATRTGFKFMITVRMGPDKGASYQLLPPKVTIGRGADNGVVFNDPKVSRQAAHIEFSMERIIITDLSKRQTLHVNGQQVPEASIKHGDVIAIGDTEFMFQVESIPLAANGKPQTMALDPALRPPMPAALRSAQGYSASQTAAPRPSGGGGNAGKIRFYAILGVAVAGLVYFLNQESGSKLVEAELRSNDTIEKETKSSEERAEKIIKKRAFKSNEEKTRFEEAQKHYLEGFRDYQKGQWIRAMRSFETAYTIDNEHQLAIRYYRYAEKQRDEMVALLTKEGLSYKDKNMYARCEAAFEKVMDTIPNKDDVKYKQANALREECRLLDGQRFE